MSCTIYRCPAPTVAIRHFLRTKLRLMARAPAQYPSSQRVFKWSYDENLFDVPYDVAGSGEKLLLLPAMNMASTRKEFTRLVPFLADGFETYACDWPGFGDASRLNLYYTPDLFYSFITDFIHDVLELQSTAVIASGHASGFVLQLANRFPHLWTRVGLLSPTYKSPGTLMEMSTVFAALLRGAFYTPLIGSYLYSRATNPEFLRKQYESHVFKDKTHVTDAFIQERYNVVNKDGGAYAPSCFFTGQVDVIHTRDELIRLATALNYPLKIVYGDSSPQKSLEEMEALKECPELDVISINGALGIGEESPEEVGHILSSFLTSKTAES